MTFRVRGCGGSICTLVDAYATAGRAVRRARTAVPRLLHSAWRRSIPTCSPRTSSISTPGRGRRRRAAPTSAAEEPADGCRSLSRHPAQAGAHTDREGACGVSGCALNVSHPGRSAALVILRRLLAPMTASWLTRFVTEIPDSTQRSPWRFSGRPTAPPWKQPFAKLLMKTEFGSSGHSRESTDDSKVPDCRDGPACLSRPAPRFAAGTARSAAAWRALHRWLLYQLIMPVSISSLPA